MKGPYTGVSAYKYNHKTISNIVEEIKIDLEYFKGRIIEWNENRMKSISKFGNKAK